MSHPRKQAILGIGANLGERWATISAALERLRLLPGVSELEPSDVFETEPVGGIEQPAFLNLVVGLETTLTPEQLLLELHGLERSLGRDRAAEVRWGPRTLDLDILLFEGETRQGAGLQLPHPRMWERAFVTTPLRCLLETSPRYTGERWPAVAARLAKLPTAAGVRPWIVT